MLKLYNKIVCFAFAVLLFLSSNGQAVIKNTGTPDPSVDYDRLSNIDTLINGYVDRGWVPGVVTLIVKDGKVIQNKGCGYSNVAAKKPMTPNSIFRLASQTKAIVSAAILMLYDQGKISLENPVSKFLPGFTNQTVLDKYNAAVPLTQRWL